MSADNEILLRVKEAENLLQQSISIDLPDEIETADVEAEIVEVETTATEVELDTQLAVEQIPEIKLDVDEDLDEELLEIFLEEAQEIMEAAGTALQRWQSEPENLRSVAE